MIKLLKFEWRKLWQQKSLYIIFVIGLVGLILSLVSMRLFYGDMGATEASLLALQYSNYVSIVGASLVGIYITLFACGDYSQHTIKNIYARGYSRSAVYFSKYLISLFVTLAMAIIFIAVTFLFTLVLSGKVGTMPVGFNWGDLFLQLWVLVGMHGLYFGISMMIGKLAGSLAINLVGITLVFLILNTMIMILKINFEITKYQLEYILMGLSGPMGLQMADKPELMRALLVPAGYAVFFVFGGWLVNNRRDV